MTATTAPPRNPVLWTTSRVPPWFAFTWAAMLLWGTIVVDLERVAPLVTGSAFVGLFLVALAAVPARVELGSDGLRIAWLGRSRVVRWQDVKRAAPYRGDVIVMTKSGAALRVGKMALGGDVPDAILERLWEAVSAGAEMGVRPNERAALARGARSPERWVEELRALASHGGQYRQGLGLDRPRLWAIAENPAAAPDLRAGAAISIAATLADDERTRLRELAAAIMEPKLRAAFERVADARDVGELEAVAQSITS